MEVQREVYMRQYNDRTVYESFNDYFKADCGIQALNISPTIIHGSPRPDRGYRCNKDGNYPISINKTLYQYTMNFFWSLLFNCSPG